MKTLEELDLSRYSGSINEIFMNKLASCNFIKATKISQCWGIQAEVKRI